MNGFVDETGKTIADEKLAEAASTGQLRAMPGTRVHFVDTTGRPVTVDAEEAGQALDAGFTPESSSSVLERERQKQFGTIGQKAITAAEGVGRGVSFGAYDAIATGLGGEEYRRNAESRQAVNPLTAGAGELVGAIAPALLTGGASAEVSGGSMAARAATAIPRAATGIAKAALPFAGETRAARMMVRAGQGAMSGLLEGAIYGAGSAAGSSALHGDELTAEKVLSGAGHGALIGGLLGGVMGGASGSFEKLPTRQGDDLLMAAKSNRLERALQKQTEADGKVASALERSAQSAEKKAGLLDRIASDRAIASVKPGPKTVSRYARTPADVDELVQQAGQDYLNYTIRTGPMEGKRIFHAASSPVDALDDISHAWGETDQVLRQFKSKAADAIRLDPNIAPSTAGLSSRIEADLAEQVGAKEARTLARTHLAPLREAQQMTLLGVADRASPLEALEAARNGLTDALESASKPAEIKALQSMRRSVESVLNETTEKALERAGLDTAAFRAEERTHRSLSFVKDAVEQLKLAQHSGKRGFDNSAAAYALGSVLSGNFGGALGVGATMLGQRFLRDRADGLVAELARRVSNADVKINWGAKALSGDGFRFPVRSAAINVLSEREADRVYSAIGQMATDRRKMEDYAVAQTSDLARQYPALAMQVQKGIADDVAYLASKIPERYNRASATLTPNAIKNVGSRTDARDFAERVAALEDPGFVVNELLHGRIPTAAIETLKERRPKIWQQLREQVMTETAMRHDELPFRRRLTLGEAFEFPADRSQLPGMLAEIQASVMPPAPGAPAQPSSADQAATVGAMSLPYESGMQS